MRKKLFILLIALMSLSLIGIIFVQGYYINSTVKNKEDQFWFKVKNVLSNTIITVQDREYKEVVDNLNKLISENGKPDSKVYAELSIIKHDDEKNVVTIFDTSVLEDNYKVPALIDIGLDSTSNLNVSKLTAKKKTTTQVLNDLKLDGNEPTIKRLESTKQQVLSISELVLNKSFKEVYEEQAKNEPIHKRVSKNELKNLIDEGLKREGIELPYEFSIYSKDLATKVQTEDFLFLGNKSKGYPIFSETNPENYTLFVSFPTRNKYIISSVLGVTLLSFLFTGIIIVGFSSSIYQLIKQRQISQIKTDFINNMTHEFKTPIATINLALDAIKNPKIIKKELEVKRYLKMIKEENKRMHAQVENVLRISKLEKNQLNISKDRVEINDLILDAVTHIELIVEDRKGYINLHLNAKNPWILANESHFTNVIINILDNAIKYSDNEPKIDVYTENVGNNIIIKIADQGNGMSKSVQKKVFEKFYREHTGNVHNVKGHGLGLAYVKQIVNDHNGHVSVESEKGIGSTFIIKLPLIS